MIAELYDIRLEMWLRARNSGNIKWKTKTGEEIPIKDMTDSHLKNVYKILEQLEEY